MPTFSLAQTQGLRPWLGGAALDGRQPRAASLSPGIAVLWLAFGPLPGVLARSLGLVHIILWPSPQGGHLSWFAHLLPRSERPVECRWPTAPLLACKEELGVVAENSGSVFLLF